MVGAFVAANMPPLMFASVIAFLVLGYPVAFTLVFLGFGWGFIGAAVGVFDLALFQALPLRVLGIMANETLLAIPFFALMGLILERSRLAEELIQAAGELFGGMRGGLAVAVVVVGTILAGPMGVAAASVIAMGLISLPAMLRHGYDRRLAAGVIAASGTLAQIVPPSLVLIVLADQLGRSVGDMYRGALVPSLLLAGLYLAFVLVVARLFPKAAPALSPGERPAVGWRLVGRAVLLMLPTLSLLVVVLGSVFVGLATPTEAGAVGAAGALVLAAARRKLTLSVLRDALERTARLSALVLFILIGARVFALTFYGVDGHLWVERLLGDLPGGAVGFLIIVNLAVFVLAFFLDFLEIAFIIVPLLAPVAAALGIDLVWFGVVLSINIQAAFMHPPFGYSLFFLRSVAPKAAWVDAATGRTLAPVTTGQIYAGAVPFILIQLVVLGLTIALPELVLHYRSDEAVREPPGDLGIPPPAYLDEAAGGLILSPPRFD